jgi:hypothetical protein
VNAAELLDRIFDVYKKSFWKQLSYAALVGVAAFVLVLAVVGAGIANALLQWNFSYQTQNIPSVIFITAAFVLLLVLFWQGAASAGAIVLSRQAFLGEPIKLQARGFPAIIGRALSAVIAQIVIAVPYLAVSGGLLFAYFYFIPVISELWLLRVYYIFSALLLFAAVAGFFMYMHVFSLAIAVAVNERVLFFNAARRSLLLIKGDFWRLFGIRVMGWAIIFVLSLAAQAVLTLLPSFVGLLTAGIPGAMPLLLLLQFAVGLGGIFVSFAISPMDGILTAVLYLNQRGKIGDTHHAL